MDFTTQANGRAPAMVKTAAPVRPETGSMVKVRINPREHAHALSSAAYRFNTSAYLRTVPPRECTGPSCSTENTRPHTLNLLAIRRGEFARG